LTPSEEKIRCNHISLKPKGWLEERGSEAGRWAS